MPDLNRPAPDFELPDLDGNNHRLGDYLGQIVVLYFWSAECPQVQRVDKILIPFAAGRNRDVVLLPVAANANEPLEVLRKASETRGWPIVLHDAGQVLADLFEAVTTPHIFIIDRDGLLRYRGAVDNFSFRQREPTRFHLQESIEALLAGRLPDPAETPAFGCTIVRL